MAGLVPAIHVLLTNKKVVDARHKAGHTALETEQFRRVIVGDVGPQGFVE